MKVRVDEDVCMGSGVCELLAPHLFEVGAEGVATVLIDELGPEDADSAKEAVNACPTFALSIED